MISIYNLVMYRVVLNVMIMRIQKFKTTFYINASLLDETFNCAHQEN